MFRYGRSLVTRRALSGMTLSASCPGMLGGLLHKEAAVRTRTRVRLRTDIASYRAAKLQGSAPLQHLVRRSPMTLPYMEVIEHLLDKHATDDVGIADPLHHYVDSLAWGWFQSKVVEDNNRSNREHETKDQCNKNLSRARRWSAARDAKLVEKWGREAPVMNKEYPTPSKVPEDFFMPSEASKEACKPLLKPITGSMSWPAMQSTSFVLQSAICTLLRELHSGASWGLLERTWQAALMPEGCVVQNIASGSWYMVLSVATEVLC
eukprot:4691874-Amphidinium_carterae.1